MSNRSASHVSVSRLLLMFYCFACSKGRLREMIFGTLFVLLAVDPVHKLLICMPRVLLTLIRECHGPDPSQAFKAMQFAGIWTRWTKMCMDVTTISFVMSCPQVHANLGSQGCFLEGYCIIRRLCRLCHYLGSSSCSSLALRDELYFVAGICLFDSAMAYASMVSGENIGPSHTCF